MACIIPALVLLLLVVVVTCRCCCCECLFGFVSEHFQVHFLFTLPLLKLSFFSYRRQSMYWLSHNIICTCYDRIVLTQMGLVSPALTRFNTFCCLLCTDSSWLGRAGWVFLFCLYLSSFQAAQTCRPLHEFDLVMSFVNTFFCFPLLSFIFFWLPFFCWAFFDSQFPK